MLPNLRIHSFESMGTFDGPGLRLVVFLQGCNFRCLYCANPDTIAHLNRDTKITPGDEVLRRALSEKVFFGRRGGVTFSGGEPTLQSKALIPLVQMLKAEGIHTCLDTNGSILGDHAKQLYELIDLVILDCKQPNAERHIQLVGRENTQTLKTVQYLADINKPVRLRYVVVPGYSDFEEDIRLLGRRYGHFENVERLEVLPYHTYGVHKYEAMGWDYQLKDIKEPDYDEIDRIADIFREYFKCVWVQ